MRFNRLPVGFPMVVLLALDLRQLYAFFAFLDCPAAAAALSKTVEDEVHVVREWSARSLEMVTGKPVLYRNSHDEYVRPYQVYH